MGIYLSSKRKLSRASGHPRLLRRNLVTDLLQHESVVTTEARARQVRGAAEKMITLAKDGSLHSRRRATAFVFTDKATQKLFDELAKRYAGRSGGYTRIVKLGPRKGDGAPMAKLELVR